MLALKPFSHQLQSLVKVTHSELWTGKNKFKALATIKYNCVELVSIEEEYKDILINCGKTPQRNQFVIF